ncbi:unnamed protein product [Somion occarium]|uniref:Uncharacterized protein n=1 Tax=Somion occarium TaxID=3059160 RepID=A0ABP1E066_9APHY
MSSSLPIPRSRPHVVQTLYDNGYAHRPFSGQKRELSTSTRTGRLHLLIHTVNTRFVCRSIVNPPHLHYFYHFIRRLNVSFSTRGTNATSRKAPPISQTFLRHGRGREEVVKQPSRLTFTLLERRASQIRTRLPRVSTRVP